MESRSTQKNINNRHSCSLGSSSKVYYYHSNPVGIPFKWEDSPGKPKNPEQLFDFIPPLSPPPATQSPCRAPDVASSSTSPLKSWLSKVVFGGRRDQQTGGRGGKKADLRYPPPPPPKCHSSTFKDGSYWSFQMEDCSRGNSIKKWKNISRIMVCGTRGF